MGGYLKRVFNLDAEIVMGGVGGGSVGMASGLGPNLEKELNYKKKNPTRRVLRVVKKLSEDRLVVYGVRAELKGKLMWKALSRKKQKKLLFGQSSKTRLSFLAASSRATLKTAIGSFGFFIRAYYLVELFFYYAHLSLRPRR